MCSLVITARVHSALTVQPEGVGSPRRCRLGHATQKPVMPSPLHTPVPPDTNGREWPSRQTDNPRHRGCSTISRQMSGRSVSAVGQLVGCLVFDRHHHRRFPGIDSLDLPRMIVMARLKGAAAGLRHLSDHYNDVSKYPVI